MSGYHPGPVATHGLRDDATFEKIDVSAFAMDGIHAQQNQSPNQSTVIQRRWIMPFRTVGGLGTLIAGIVVACLLLQATQRSAADPSVPFVLEQTQFLQKSTPQSLKIGTFNIHSGKGTDGTQNLALTVEVIPDDVDFLWLNEVRSGMFGLRTDQTQFLGLRTKRASVFLPTEQQYFHGHFGNAILTRRPVGAMQYLSLPCTQGKRFRNATISTVKIEGGSIRILATHLDEKVDRQIQLHQIRELFHSLEAPAMLIGDLNTRSHEDAMQRILSPGTSPTQKTRIKNALAGKTDDRPDGHGVDWIIVKGLDVVDAGLIETEASDHPLLWAEVRIPPVVKLAEAGP